MLDPTFFMPTAPVVTWGLFPVKAGHAVGFLVPQPPMKGPMSSLARWFQLNAHQPLAVLLAQARSNGHTKEAVNAAIAEYHNSGEA